MLALGGEAALAPAVTGALSAAGYAVQRVAGASRVETALAVAGLLGDPAELLVATGSDFADALAAGPAAVAVQGAVLLTAGATPHPAVDAYLTDRADAVVTAIGGPAATAYPTAVAGATRDETAVAVAETFFDAPTVVGLARQDLFADALGGGSDVARRGGPLLLTDGAVASAPVTAYLCSLEGVVDVVVYGGVSALSDAVVSELVGPC